MIRAKAYFMGARERKRTMNRIGNSPAAVSKCNAAAEQVKAHALDNIAAGQTLTSSKGSGLAEQFSRELETMSSTLNNFPAKTFFRKNVASMVGTSMPVAIISYGVDQDSKGPVYGSLWEFGSAGVSDTERPRLAALRRAFESVGRGV